METNNAKSVNVLSDNDLVASMEFAVVAERESVARSIALLGEMVRRDLHTRLGYSSVYAMLTQRFRMSESNASKRSAAVMATRRFPEILPLIEGGAMNLSNLALIARRVNDANKDRLVAAACRLTQRQLEEFIARDFAVAAPRRETIRAVAITPVASATFRGKEGGRPIGGLFDRRDGASVKVSSSARGASFGETPSAKESSSEGVPPLDVSSPGETSFAKESSPGETPFVGDSTPEGAPSVGVGLRVAVTIEGEAKAALMELRRLNPGKSVTDILAEAIVAHRDRVTPAARASAPKRAPRLSSANDTGTAPATRRSRYIPKAVRHEVFTRDGGRCAYVAPDGRRCGCEVGIEFDHVRPVAFGGDATARNLRLLCRPHNLMAAKDSMGKAFIESRMGRAGGGGVGVLTK